MVDEIAIPNEYDAFLNLPGITVLALIGFVKELRRWVRLRLIVSMNARCLRPMDSNSTKFVVIVGIW